MGGAMGGGEMSGWRIDGKIQTSPKSPKTSPSGGCARGARPPHQPTMNKQHKLPAQTVNFSNRGGKYCTVGINQTIRNMAATRSQLRKRGGGKGRSGSAAKSKDDGSTNKGGKDKEESKEEGEDFEIVYKNGKAYRKYKDLPDVGYLITYGLPGQEGKSTRDPTKPW